MRALSLGLRLRLTAPSRGFSSSSATGTTSPEVPPVVSYPDLSEIHPGAARLTIRQAIAISRGQPIEGADVPLPKPLEVSSQDDVGEAVRLMVEHNTGAVLVTDGTSPLSGRPGLVGILTERDYMRKAFLAHRQQRASHASLGSGPRQHGSAGNSPGGGGQHLPCRYIMTSQPSCVAPEDTLDAAFKILRKGGFRHIPIVSGDEKFQGREALAGILSIRHLAKCLHSVYSAEPNPASDKRVKQHVAKLPRTSQFLTAKPTDEALVVVEQMVNKDVGCVLVTENDKLVGIVTERDYMRTVQKASHFHFPVRDIMVAEPIVVHPESTIRDAMEIVAQRGFRHLPVVDDQRRPVGAVSIRALLQALCAP